MSITSTVPLPSMMKPEKSVLELSPPVVRVAAVTAESLTVPEPASEPMGYRPENVATVLRAMVGVTQGGTSRAVFVGAPYLSGGKTGTAQAVSIGANSKYNAAKLSEYQRDHSLYIAFAPADKPRIAVAAIVENAGFGAVAAAPIVRRVMDYWIAGVVPSAEDMKAVQRGQATTPIGAPRPVSELPSP